MDHSPELDAPAPPGLPPIEAQSHTQAAEDVTILGRIRGRILSGLFLALPLLLAAWLLGFVYRLLRSAVLDPFLKMVRDYRGEDALDRLPAWWVTYVSPLIAIALILVFLYFLGLFAQSRIYQLVNRVLLRVPFVTTVYQAVLNVFQALESQRKSAQYRRVVLVEFPQPGMRSLGLVTNSMKDQKTGKTIVCVCVLTGVMPPTGFTLFVPEESVTDLDWSMNQAIQAIVSGGITAPGRIAYYSAAPPSSADPGPAKPGMP